MKTCLIVEDANFMVDLYRYLLKDLPIQFIGSVDDGARAVEVIRAQQPDLVLLDLILPVKNGFDVLAECSGLKTQFVAVSSINDPSLQKKALDLGAIYFIEKPFKKMELINAFEQVIYNQEVKHG